MSAGGRRLRGGQSIFLFGAHLRTARRGDNVICVQGRVRSSRRVVHLHAGVHLTTRTGITGNALAIASLLHRVASRDVTQRAGTLRRVRLLVGV